MVDLTAPFTFAILLGSFYTLMAAGLTLTYAVTRVPNFAHAEYVTVGAYTAVLMVNVLGRTLAEAVLLATFVTALVALASDETVFKPLFRRKGTPLYFLVASIGVGLVIRYVLSIFADVGGMLSVKSNVVASPLVEFGRGSLSTVHLWVLPSTAAAVILLHLLFTRTRVGKGMRALASNFDLARVSGIPTVRIRQFTWLLAGGLAGLAGALWSVYTSVHPETGWRALLWIFAASILGGFVSFYGTIAGGYIVGFAENFGISILSQEFGVAVSYRPLIALAIIVAVFLVRPKGFAGVDWADVREAARGIAERVRRTFGSGG